jgi:hypothetical protein
MAINLNHVTDTITPSSGTLKTVGTVESTTGGFKFPDGTTMVTAAPSAKFDLIQAVTATNSSAVDFTGLSSTYSHYILFVNALSPQFAGTNLYLRYGYDSSGTPVWWNSSYSINRMTMDSTGYVQGTGTTASQNFVNIGTMSNTGTGYSLQVDLFNFSSSSENPISKSHFDNASSSTSMATADTIATCTAGTNATALRVYGNYTISGRFYLYGAKSS